MRRLVHLSDLHFGRTDQALINAIVDDVTNMKPAYAAISGDFTQRARPSQFQEAATFLKRLPCPYIAIPGNHDIPLYHWPLRLLQPLQGYRRHINTETNPVIVDSEVILTGLNTVTRWRWKEGRVRGRQLLAVRKIWSAHPDSVRVLVTHHPPAEGFMRFSKVLGEKPDLILSGHLHKGGAVVHADGPLLVAAGTATSNRLRGETNAYNVIDLECGDPHLVTVVTRAWNGSAFEDISRESFAGREGRWSKTI